ncbi:MAG: hypothetical protein Q7K98_01160 [Candidatus Omnitrophota bacterium]|nr:hypothetical protein [Candidatus Omnitrophota bacterium]
MLEPPIRVLDFDGSVIKQHNLLSQYPHQIIALKDMAPGARLWMNKRVKRAILERLRQTRKNCVTFLGSGDFHHLSLLLLEQFQEPISLITFDFHPDWDILPPRLACGSWVTQALKKKNILKCALIGVSSDDLSWPGIQSANLACLKHNRLEIYPYVHAPSAVFLRRVPQNISLKARPSFLSAKIYWEELKSKNLEDFFRSLIRRLPAEKVYLSIDKDCLRNEFALTNWEEGKLALDELILMLRLIKENLEIVGLDISGDYSKIAPSGLFKDLISRFDHPHKVEADKISGEEITRVNQSTNLKILETIFS